AKGIPFEAKIGLQVFSGGVTQSDLPAHRQQNWTMKDCEKRHAHSKRRGCATPPASRRLCLCLTVFGHQSDCISTLTKSKEQMTLFALQSRESCCGPEGTGCRYATRVASSVPLPAGLRAADRLLFPPNKEQRANDAVRTSKPGIVLRTGRDCCGGSRIGCMGAVGDEISFREKMASRRSRRLIK